ncbi:hypothetical protein [Streptomyces sp. NPDC097619]|uniref:hypothetical protein n=1 Tax=Streptomyces sp. NPDC097619 TaxID=3157228 RepID=UPI0033277C4D
MKFTLKNEPRRGAARRATAPLGTAATALVLGLAVAAVTGTTGAAAAAPAAPLPLPTAESAPSGARALPAPVAPAPSVEQASVAGRWEGFAVPRDAGITRYVRELTLTADGRFTLVPGFVCGSGQPCPQFKIAPIEGTYRVTDGALDLVGSFDTHLTGTVHGRHLIALDGEFLHRSLG